MKTKISHNQRIKRLWPIVAGAGLLFAGAAQAVDVSPTDMIVDGGDIGFDIGDVSWVVNSDGTVSVTHELHEPNWCMTAIHVAVALDESGIPNSKGNPIPGQFAGKKNEPYGAAIDPIEICETGPLTVTVPVPEDCTDTFVIAAHSVNVIPHVLDAIDTEACTHADMTVYWPGYNNYPSYLDIDVTNSNGFDGLHDGWCIDADHGITPGQGYSCKLYPGEADPSDLPADLVPDPANLGAANWLVNQHFAGEPSTELCNYEPYTFGDIQKALWFLVDDNDTEEGGLLEWTQCKAEALEAAALMHTDFKPGPGDVFTLICDVHGIDLNTGECVDLDVQTTMFEFPAPRDETAWGAGLDFSGSNWAMYITAACPAPVVEP